MDIYDYLKLDHEHVAQLFKHFEHSKLQERRKQIAALIAQELIVHARSEQETFYAALKQFDSTKDEALHGQKEHKEIEAQINLIVHSKEFGASWVNKVEKLKEIVEHHVNEEEGDIFKHAKNVLSKEDAWIIKEQMHYLKQHLLLSLKKDNSSKLLAPRGHKNAKGASSSSEKNTGKKQHSSKTTSDHSSRKSKEHLAYSKKSGSKIEAQTNKKTKSANKKLGKKNETDSHAPSSH